MYQIVVSQFGGIDQLKIVQKPDPVPGAGQVVVKLTSIGMNHAELMQRAGRYKAASGDPPFVPGLEGGGVIAAVGPGVDSRRMGQRVSLGLDVTRRQLGGAGTYTSHYLAPADKTIPAPDAIPDHLLGALWLPYLTAWGCLIWRQQLKSGQTVLIPAAGSSVGIAASQVVKEAGAIAIGTTTSPEKIAALGALPAAKFDHLIVTGDPEWHKAVRKITGGKGVDVIFDPVAAGEFLDTEIRLLATGGTIWVYGLLGEPGKVDVSPLIMKRGSIRGWVLTELAAEPPDFQRRCYDHVLAGVADGRYRMPVAGVFSLREAQKAHAAMEAGRHIGKMILIP